MPTTQQLRNRLANKLKELFQLDQPDLDFGFYRIMHAKAGQVTDFIENDLLQIVTNAFGQLEVHDSQERLTRARERLIQTLGNAALDADGNLVEAFKNTPAGKSYLAGIAAIAQIKDTLSAEAEIYDHLYRFFERYYDSGDFISRRYYTRETAGRAAPFAIPYHGEEVKLHWANADQYYIKTAEYFTNFTFDLRQASEVQMPHGSLDLDLQQEPLRVHFRIVEATEGEHGNIKASDADKRFFILYGEQPVALTEDGELIIQFEYRPDPEKSGQDATWRARRNKEAVETILSRLEEMAVGNYRLTEYLHLFRVAAPTDKDNDRPLLAKYINRYTARNSMDYFIHKDLGGFLRRELDFYIKNEVMRLDDIEHAEAPSVERYLDKLRVLRRIAGKLIDFLTQLEEFQKKLWLKKKFVVETNYCITLDRVPEALYPDIAANDAQREEWMRLFAIDTIGASTTGPGYSVPLTVDFLKTNDMLVLDTQFFDEAFTAKLIASIEEFDAQCDGLLMHSENFQALNLLQRRYQNTIQSIYIDPPYNTSASEIIYKNSYKNSSWLTFLAGRVQSADKLLKKEGILCITIDDFEFHRLRMFLDDYYIKENILGVIAIKNNPSGRSTAKGFSIAHEYGIFATKMEQTTIGRLQHSDEQVARYKFSDKKGQFEWANFRKHGGANANRRARPKLFYPIFISESTGVRFPQIEWNDSAKEWKLLEEPHNDEIIKYPITPTGEEKTWKWGNESARAKPDEFTIRREKGGDLGVYKKARINQEGTLPLTVWDKSAYSSTEYGTNLLKRIFGESEKFSFPKSVFATIDCLRVSNADSDATVLDYFGGSGTTGHAVINLNREDDGERKYILVEMGDYFDTVLKPRIAKVVYSPDWKDGKPTNRDKGISHCFKYLRLESYEDALNNLHMEENPTRDRALAANPALKEDYMLHYLLDVETRGSQSLLNIDAVTDPTAYSLQVKKPGTDEYVTRSVDLVETFNYLLGLRVAHLAAPQRFNASFIRHPDPELPQDQHTRLMVDGDIREDDHGPWWFRTVEGWVPADTVNPNNGQREKVLIIWRKLTGDQERDNVMLDTWFRRSRSSRDSFAFDTIYVNGSNNLPNLKVDGESWKVRLIEEEFMKRMWDVEGL